MRRGSARRRSASTASELRINSYLAERPEQVLGALKLGRGLYDSGELVVEQLADVPALAELISSWGRRFAASEPAASVFPQTPLEPEPAPPVLAAPEGLWDGHLLALPDGGFAEVREFCDLSTPAQGWNAYDELRSLLSEHGIPRDRIRAIHEARNDAEKGRLFAACRSGHVSVLVGSTEKMGVGTNVQTRAIALHHLDCPWRPADIEQREGRILRQGNQNSQVGIYRYVVERSFDAYSWQTVERKAKFISQVTHGRLDVRQIDDIGESTLSYTEVKALASGDPLLLEYASAANELTKLQRQRRAWERNRQLLHDTAVSAEAREQARGTDIEQVDAALRLRTDTRGERFAMTIGPTRYADRRAAADALSRWAKAATLNQARPLGELGALKLTGVVGLDYQHGGREAHVSVDGVPVEAAHASLKHLQENPLGLVRQLEHRVQDLDGLRGRLLTRQQEAAQEGVRAREALAKPFKHTDALAAAERKIEQIEQQIRGAPAQEVSAPPSASTDDVWPGPGTRVPPPPPRWTPPVAPRMPAAPLSTPAEPRLRP